MSQFGRKSKIGIAIYMFPHPIVLRVMSGPYGNEDHCSIHNPHDNHSGLCGLLSSPEWAPAPSGLPIKMISQSSGSQVAVL